MVVNMAGVTDNTFNANVSSAANKENKEKRNTIYAGDMNQELNPAKNVIEQRKEEAKKQAMKIVSDAFGAEQSLDDTVDSFKEDQSSRMAENVDLMKAKAEVEQQVAEGGLDEAALDDAKTALEEYSSRIDDNKKMIAGDSNALQGIRISRNKTHAMVDAKNQADTILDNVSEEAINTLLQDGKDKVDEDLQEAKEEAQQKKDESGTKEEQASYDAASVDQELAGIRDKMKLLEEDIKGAAVDEQL